MKKIFFSLLIFMFCSASQVYGKNDWKVYKSRHFYFYYQNTPRDFLESVEDSAEVYYDEITRNLGFSRYKGWSFEDRAKIYIYDDKEHYISTGAAKWSGGVAHAQAKVIKTFPTAAGFFDSTLPHELGHIIFREFIGYYASVPLWFEEGIASFQEKARRWGANRVVKNAIKDGSFIPLDELSRVRLTRNTDRKTIDLFYAESASVIYYMITELGQHRFVKFCRKMESLKSFDRALSAAYNRFDSLKDLNRSWVRYLEGQ